MAEWEDIFGQAAHMPLNRERMRLLSDALDRADAVNAVDGAFDIRVDIIHTAYRVGDPMAAMTAFAWCRSRMAQDPQRFERHEYMVDWFHKWMPTWAMQYPSVGPTRLVAMIDELEERHVSAGKGRRQALALRMQLNRNTGLGPSLEGLLLEWRTSARSSVSDCAACEVLAEAKTLDALGDSGGALAALDPTIDGRLRFCGDGPEEICAVAVPLLIEADRSADAAAMFRQGLRNSREEARKIHSVAALIAIAARCGEIERSRKLATSTVSLLDDAPTPYTAMRAAASLSAALVRVPAGTDLGLAVEAPGSFGRAGGAGQTWRSDDLAAALAERARRVAASFDERNGNDLVSREVETTLTEADLAPMTLFRVPATKVADEGALVAGELNGSGPVGPTPELATAPPARPDLLAEIERTERSRQLIAAAEEAPEPTTALRMIRDAIDLVRDMGPTPALAEARYAMGRRLELVERRDEATVHLAEAADLFERSGQLGRAAATMVLWGRIELDLGEVMRSTDIVDDALLLVGESNDDDEIATCCDVLSLGAELDLRNWNNVRAAERLTGLLTLSERCGRPTAEPRAKLAVVLGRTGELDRALELIDAVADDIASQGTYSDRVRALVGEDRAQVLRQAGRLADATEVAREAAGFARAGGDRMLEMRLRRAVADHTFAAWTGTWQESDWADDWDDEDEDDEAGTGASDPPTAMRDRGDPALRDAVIASTRAVFEVEAGDQLLEPRERDYLRRRLDDLGE